MQFGVKPKYWPYLSSAIHYMWRILFSVLMQIWVIRKRAFAQCAPTPSIYCQKLTSSSSCQYWLLWSSIITVNKAIVVIIMFPIIVIIVQWSLVLLLQCLSPSLSLIDHCHHHNPEQKEIYRGGTLVRGLCCVVVQRRGLTVYLCVCVFLYLCTCVFVYDLDDQLIITIIEKGHLSEWSLLCCCT